MEAIDTTDIGGVTNLFEDDVLAPEDDVQEEYNEEIHDDLEDEAFELLASDEDEDDQQERRHRRNQRTPLRSLRRARVSVAGRRGHVSIPTQRGAVRAQLSERFIAADQLNAALRRLEENNTRNCAVLRADLRRVDNNAVERNRAVERATRRALAEQTRAIRRQAAALRNAEERLRQEINEARQMGLVTALMNRNQDGRHQELLQANNNGEAQANRQTGLNGQGQQHDDLQQNRAIDTLRNEADDQNNVLPLLLLSGALNNGNRTRGGQKDVRNRNDHGNNDSNMLALALALGGGL